MLLDRMLRSKDSALPVRMCLRGWRSSTGRFPQMTCFAVQMLAQSPEQNL